MWPVVRRRIASPADLLAILDIDARVAVLGGACLFRIAIKAGHQHPMIQGVALRACVR